MTEELTRIATGGSKQKARLEMRGKDDCDEMKVRSMPQVGEAYIR